jgi:hypothetical protein
MDIVAEIKGLLEQHKCETVQLINQQHQQFLEQQRKLGDVFEALDKRLMLIENGLVVTAGDVSQARHNTHQIRNLLQTLTANQELIFTHFGIAPEPPPPAPISAHDPRR